MAEPRKLILHNFQSPGDIVMLTAAVRDLHLQHPGQFQTDIRCSAMGLWENNPFLTALDDKDPSVEVLRCQYPLIHQSNSAPFHFVHGFAQNLGEQLGVPLVPSRFHGDIHISDEEKSWISQVHEIIGSDEPFWIVVAGGKNDFTIKWWDSGRYQEVVDYFKERIRFVQVGESGHHHPPLEGVIDLRGKTDLRQLVRLVYHAQGVLCPVTLLMHLAAAVPTKPGLPRARPCVVVAGGREPSHWEAYPHHRYLHTQGALSCCQNGGCWRSRTVPLGDGDSKDNTGQLCVDVVGNLPRCMDMISARRVIESIEEYFLQGVVSYLQPKSSSANSSNKLTQSTDSATSPSPPKNEVYVQVFGLRRSGLHPIINWLAGQYEGPVCFINDFEQKAFRHPEFSSDPLPSFTENRQLAVALGDDKQLLLIAFEDDPLVTPPSLPSEKIGKVERSVNLLILRDPFNTFASRLQAKRTWADSSQTHAMVGQKGSLPNLWKHHAKEYLRRQAADKPDLLILNFNSWVQDDAYRAQFCEKLGVTINDKQLRRVPSYGQGSSFDGVEFDRQAEQMAIFKRWKLFEDDPEFLDFFEDTEVVSLAEEIFGADCIPTFLQADTK